MFPTVKYELKEELSDMARSILKILQSRGKSCPKEDGRRGLFSAEMVARNVALRRVGGFC
jgi:hypothetical protein